MPRMIRSTGALLTQLILLWFLSDIIKSPYSAIVDLAMTRVVDGDLVKVLAWYDNEWGYSCRLVEMAVLVSC
ncbi:MAG: hypothetical protein KatS3mg101_0601 [Patescibacteria group bacterium]|nr:MAG: hypothetical protein KatS3mg101_0601 [Patescibacteria group bacterium]